MSLLPWIVARASGPALEGGRFWFMPAVRASVPLGATHGRDLEAGRILGASHQFATIRSFLAGQLRFRREPAEDLVDRYWLVGLRHLRMTKLDAHGGVLRYDPDTLSIGHGWRHTFENGAGALTEVGFGGGEGFMGYVSFGVQWRFPVRRSAHGSALGGGEPRRTTAHRTRHQF